MSMTMEVDELAVVPGPRAAWGWYLGSGIAWFVIGVSIMSWNPTTIGLISVLVGGVVVLAGMAELANAFLSEGWRWLHAIVGALFVVAGVAAFLQPFRTFAALAMVFGWYLLFKGMVEIVVSIALAGSGALWGLGLVVGAMNLIIGMWAIGYPGRSAWLLVLWIGIGAVLHGIADFVHAFQIRSAR